MHRTITPGKIIAFVVSLILVFVGWSFIFSPNGTGSNIILGIMIAGFFVYMITKDFGAYIDQTFFHGGSRERAILYHNAERELNSLKQRVEQFLKKRKYKSRAGSKEHAAFEAAMAKLHETLLEIRANWTRNQSVIEKHIARLKQESNELQNSAKALMGSMYKQTWLSGASSLAGALVLALAIRFFIFEPFQIPSGSMLPTVLVGDHIFVSKFTYGIMNPFSLNPSYLFRWAEPKPGDVVVFQSPMYVGGEHAGAPWIKRVIAGPGQKVRVLDDVVYVDGKPYEHVIDKTLVNYMDYYPRGLNGGTWREEQAYYTREKIGEVIHDSYVGTSRNFVGDHDTLPSNPAEYIPLRSKCAADYCKGLKCTDEYCEVAPGHVLVMGDNRPSSHDGRYWGALPIDNIKGKASFIWISVNGSKKSLDLGRFFIPGFNWSRSFKKIH